MLVVAFYSLKLHCKAQQGLPLHIDSIDLDLELLGLGLR